MEAGYQTPQGFPAAAEMLAMMYDASLDRIYSRSQSLSVYYNRYIPYYYWDINNNNGKSYAPYFPTKSWRVPVWHFDYFTSPYNGVAEVLQIVEDNAAINGVTVVGYGSARSKAATGGLKIRGYSPQSSNAALSATEEAGQAVEVKYVPAQVEEAVTDVVFESELFLLTDRRYSRWLICVLILQKRLSSIPNCVRMNRVRSLSPSLCRRV